MTKKSKETIRVTDFPKHEVSPFFKGLYQVKTGNKTIAVGSGQYGLFDRTSGNVEVDKTAFIGVRKIVDKGEFIKVYKGAIFALFDVSKKAQLVFAYFMTAMKMNDHEVYFDAKECMEKTGYRSTRSVWEGLGELLKKGFIARSQKTHIYYINPELAFNGDRLFQFHDWIKKGSETHEKIIEEEQKQKQRTLNFKENSDVCHDISSSFLTIF